MKDILKHNKIFINNKNELILNGVKCVESFDSCYLKLEIDEGSINVEGNDLKIVSLNQEDGEMTVNGNIEGIFYSKEKLFKRKFRGFIK